MKVFFASMIALAAGATANAGVIGHAIQISATNGTNSASWFVDVPETAPWTNGAWQWTAPAGGLEMREAGSNTLVAAIDGLQIRFEQDPVVNINFSVTASSSDTIFTITSGLLTFAPFNAEALASATLTVTDSDSSGLAYANGAYGGGDVYRANLNGSIPGPTVFADLVPGFSVGLPPGSDTDNEFLGWVPVGIVSSQQASYSFTLSANDSASGTSTFITRTVIPAPASLALLGVAGALAGRRRR